jgi:hypothetical protein
MLITVEKIENGWLVIAVHSNGREVRFVALDPVMAVQRITHSVKTADPRREDFDPFWDCREGRW